MANTGFRRVSKKRPCCICQKPDWCSTTETGTISFCARSTLNAHRVSRYGWGVYYHDASRPGFDNDFDRSFNRFSKRKKTSEENVASSPGLRDKVYRKMIELSPASSNSGIVNGRGGLMGRRIHDPSQYGDLPRLVNQRRALVERLLEVLAKEGVRSFDGIPGFWRNRNGRLWLWSEHDSFDDLMLIPFVGPDGLIRACQIRFMRYMADKSGRYVWLSSLKERNGSGPDATLHHACPWQSSAKPVLVTEGALKAATAQRFLSDRYVVGNSGVATSHREIVETARGKPLEIAFDSDGFTNPHVARALAALIRRRLSDQRSFAYGDEVTVLAWDRRIKGLDEALLSGLQPDSLTIPEWLKELSPDCFEQARQQLSI